MLFNTYSPVLLYSPPRKNQSCAITLMIALAFLISVLKLLIRLLQFLNFWGKLCIDTALMTKGLELTRIFTCTSIGDTFLSSILLVLAALWCVRVLCMLLFFAQHTVFWICKLLLWDSVIAGKHFLEESPDFTVFLCSSESLSIGKIFSIHSSASRSFQTLCGTVTPLSSYWSC